MSLDKAIAHGKEHRKGYRERGKSGEHDKTCRPHGGGSAWPCEYCQRNRTIGLSRLVAKANAELKSYEEEQLHPDNS